MERGKEEHYETPTTVSFQVSTSIFEFRFRGVNKRIEEAVERSSSSDDARGCWTDKRTNNNTGFATHWTPL